MADMTLCIGDQAIAPRRDGAGLHRRGGGGVQLSSGTKSHFSQKRREMGHPGLFQWLRKDSIVLLVQQVAVGGALHGLQLDFSILVRDLGLVWNHHQRLASIGEVNRAVEAERLNSALLA